MASRRAHLHPVDSSSGATTVHQLKITLRRVKPPVWRRVLVESSWTLAKLSRGLEAAMGWYGGHLHAFDAAGAVFGQPDPEWDDDVQDERKVRVGDVLTDVGAKMRWDYDFGDGWEHDVLVEAILDRDPKLRYPHCVGGRRACPPEDCGGPYVYVEFLAALGDPGHRDHQELSEWAPPGFDPARFDVDETNVVLQQR